MSVIEVKNLHKRYGDRWAVQGITLAVERGEIFGLIGPNGAGKTTLVECIAGLRRPDSGQALVLGLDPQKERQALRSRLGIQLQDSQLPDQIKVWEALDLYSSFYEEPADWEELIVALGLAEKRNDVFARLSGGQKQRLSVALAMVGNPDILILDELTTGLDPEARRNIWQLILDVRARGVTILLVTHFMEEAERLCDRLAVIDGGRIVALDTPAGIVARTGGEQRLRFRPSAPLDEELFANLPEVRRVTRNGDTVIVTGTGNLVQVVASTLAQRQIIAHELRIEQAALDDAFIALTGEKV
ncbi:MAG: ABC transporter ATP-binding protein [Chloroflexi bacterium]|jgi:ABC-2 type transport system ATP-binding protein|nr:ABC transporter ATP-binding protein [Chloroflexota bacterium]